MKDLKKRKFLLIAVVMVSTILVGGFASQSFFITQNPTPVQAAGTQASKKPSPHALDPGSVLGINTNPGTPLPGIPWVRLSYTTCGNSDLKGSVLQNTIANYHRDGVRVLLTICQQSSGPGLFDMKPLNDVAQSGADAVQCGNEEMKNAPETRYITPENFARYFDLCQGAMHKVNPALPVILGSLDPHVGWVDIAQLMAQVHYLDEMQYAMNTKVHPGGKWSWRSQILGLIDSWHNGYPNRYFNSLLGLFAFWAEELHINLNSGQLGQHLWVIEGTGCFKGCGIDVNSKYQVAVSHILTLITDVQTTMRYRVPFFYFTSKDFRLEGILWPMGILTINGKAKPLRQDLPMGARILDMKCGSRHVEVANQEQLLSTMYLGCALPDNYYSVLTR